MSRARGLSKLVSDPLFTIDSSNNIGIGSTIPANKLDVVGVLTAISHLGSGANLTGIDNINEGNTKAEVVDTGSDGHFKVETEGTERVRIGSSGEIGLSGANYGTSGQVLTSGGSGASVTWTTVSSGFSDKIEEGNTKAEVVDTGSDGHFLVETEGVERLRVISDGKVGIGTDEPNDSLLHLEDTHLKVLLKSTNLNTASSLVFDVKDVNTADFLLGQVAGRWNGTDVAYINIEAGADTTNKDDGIITFLTSPSGGVPVERLRITSGGSLGIGTDPSDGYNAATNALVVKRVGNAGITIDCSNQGGLFFSNGTGSSQFRGQIIYYHTPGDQSMRMLVDASEKLRITESGHVLVGTPSTPVGTDAQYAKFAVRGNTLNTNAAYLSLGNNKSTASTGTNDNLGIIVFNDNDSSDAGEYARIIGATDGTNGTSDYPGKLIFSTTADGASSPTERLRITSDGKIGINESTPTRTLSIDGSVNIQSGSRIESYSSNGNLIIQGGSTYPGGHIHMYGGSGDDMMTFNTSGGGASSIERMRLTSAGQLFVGSDTATPDKNFGTGMLQATNKTGYQHIQFDGHSDAAANATCLSIGRSRGTQASPTSLQNGDHIARLSANAYDPEYSNYGGAACIDFYADDNHDYMDIPAYISFKTCHDGSATLNERVKIHSAGSVLFKAGLIEKNRAVGATLGSTTNTSLNDGNVVIFNGNESGNNTVNFQNVHTPMIENSVVSFTVMIDPNNSGVINAVQIDGQSPAGGLKWQGGSQPTAGASGKDIYTFTINKYGTGATSYTVYGAKNNYS